MKKRLLCLALCALMIMSTLVFSGCTSSNSDTEAEVADEASRTTTTLNMYVMTEDKTDPEQAEAVEAAFNKITKSRFKTQVNITFLTEAEYYEALEQAFVNKEEEVVMAKEADKALRRYIKEHKAEYGNDGANRTPRQD